MNPSIRFEQPRQAAFKINYPYYGLFRTAEVSIINELEKLVRCRLNNGAELWLKKLIHSRKWIDVQQNEVTPLSNLLGNYIDEHLTK